MGASAKEKKPRVAKKDDAKVEVEIAAVMDATPDADGEPDEVAVAKEKKVKAPRFLPLPTERTAWIAAHARPAVSSCLCGCGGSTKGRFMPGHDATLKESLKASVAAGDTDAAAALETFGW